MFSIDYNILYYKIQFYSPFGSDNEDLYISAYLRSDDILLLDQGINYYNIKAYSLVKLISFCCFS